jgi:hypothetical protein
LARQTAELMAEPKVVRWVDASVELMVALKVELLVVQWVVMSVDQLDDHWVV